MRTYLFEEVLGDLLSSVVVSCMSTILEDRPTS